MIRRNALLLACCALGASALAAQPMILPLHLEQSTAARFNLSPAGPRALGLGGAFVAVADDLTAAELNPAGLAQLDRPQLLVSARSVSLDTEFAGDLLPRNLTTSETVSGPAFVGYAHPLGAVTLAGYYQEDARFESGIRVDIFKVLFDFPAIFPSPLPDFDERRYEQLRQTLGVAAGVRLNRVVSVGGALRYQRLSVDWLESLDVLPIPDLPPIGLPAFLGTRTLIDDEDSDLTLALGLLVHPEGLWTAGLSYQQGGDHRLSAATQLTGHGLPLVLLPSYEVPMALPDLVAAGAAFRPSERWLVSGQVSHVTYSDLRSRPRFHLADLAIVGPTAPFLGDEPIDDETMLHLGAEVRLGPADRPFTLRAGAWTDPDHDGIRAVDTDETHLALGAGLEIGQSWVLDGAVSFADTRTEGLLAVGYRF